MWSSSTSCLFPAYTYFIIQELKSMVLLLFLFSK